MKSKLLSSEPLHPIQMLFFILIQLLLIFDDTFSKFHLWGSVYLFDLLLSLVASWALIVIIKQNSWPKEWAIYGLMAFSVIYLVVSYMGNYGPLNYMIRQYALFIYLGLSFIILHSFTNDKYNTINIRFIKMIAVLSMGIQVGYFLYKAVILGDISFFSSFSYFSKLGIIGVIVIGPLILTHINNRVLRWSLVGGYLLVSTMLGHSSIFLAALAIIVFYIMLGSSKWFKLGGLLLFTLAIALLLLYAPQFSDQNAAWRLVFWKFTIKDVLYNYYGILGHGFGVWYAPTELVEIFQDTINSPWFGMRPEEQYLSPMHNSFMTIGFHIGLLPSLLILVPLKNAFRYFFLTRKMKKDRDADFLFLALIGASVWCSFNVVLELPHSSIFYWFLYFTVVYHFYGINKRAMDAHG